MQAPRHLKMCLKGVTMCSEWKNNVAEQPLCSPALSREWVECTIAGEKLRRGRREERGHIEERRGTMAGLRGNRSRKGK